MKLPWFRNQTEKRTVTYTDFFGKTIDGPATPRISQPEALSLSAVFCAVRLIAETISTLPIYVAQRDGDVRRRVAHPAADVLAMPNSAMSGQSMLETLFGHIELGGEAYLEKVHDNAGQLRALWPIAPERVRPELSGGQLVFHVSTKNGVVDVGSDRIAFLKNAIASSDGIRGVSPIALLNPDLAAAKAARDAARAYFANAMQPSGTLEHPASLSEPALDRLRTQFKDRYSGATNTGKPLLLEEGMKFTPHATDPEKSQLLETRQFAISDVARIWRIPPHFLADLSRSTFANAETEVQSLAIHSLRPRIVRLEKQFDLNFLTPEEIRRGLGFRIDLDGLLRGSLLDRYNSYEIGLRAGFLKVNEVRALENRPPLEKPAVSATENK